MIRASCQIHYNDVKMGAMASQVTNLTIVYSTVYSGAYENIKASRHWPLCGEFTGDRRIPRTNGQWRGKCFRLMTSSWCQIIATFSNDRFQHLFAKPYRRRETRGFEMAYGLVIETEEGAYNISARSRLEWSCLCLETDDCTSFNFVQDNMTCQLRRSVDVFYLRTRDAHTVATTCVQRRSTELPMGFGYVNP